MSYVICWPRLSSRLGIHGSTFDDCRGLQGLTYLNLIISPIRPNPQSTLHQTHKSSGYFPQSPLYFIIKRPTTTEQHSLELNLPSLFTLTSNIPSPSYYDERCKLQYLSINKKIDKMAETFDEDHHRQLYVSNQLRTNQIKTKKSSLPHDREQLYAENIDLKNRVQQLLELHIKMKTQLSVTEKEKVNLCNIVEEEAMNMKFVQRSQSGHHKKSRSIIPPFQQHNLQPNFNSSSLHKEKQNMALKKLNREQTIEIEKLNSQNQRLKKTMKNTRMNQLLAENKQLLDETFRLKGMVSDKKDHQIRLSTGYMNQIDYLRKELTREKDSEKRNGYDLKKQKQLTNQLKDKLSEIQIRKIDGQKMLNRENKKLRSQLHETKSKLYQQTVLKPKQCDKQQCLRNLKQKNQLKRKNQGHLREIKRLKDEIDQIQRLSIQKEYYSKRIENQRSISKTPEKQQPNGNKDIVIKRSVPENKIIANESKVSEKQTPQKQPQLVQKYKQETKEVQFVKIEPSIIQVQQQQKPLKQNQREIVAPKMGKNSVNPLKGPQINNRGDKQEINQHQDSMDTQKLLASFDGDKGNELVLQSSKKLQEKLKTEQKEKDQEMQISKKLVESDGQYEELNMDEFDNDDVNVNQKGKILNKQDRKEIIEKNKSKFKQKDEEKAKEPKKEKTKRDKSKKKLQEGPQQQQLLFKKDQDKRPQQSDQSGLKLIRQTLLFKFMAQNYSYDNFCSDIKNSDMKTFTISDVLNLLGTEPFMLQDFQVQTVIIYIFDTQKLAGNESLSSKDFIKKMKKFIGKSINIDQNLQRQNIQKLTSIIEKDVSGPGTLRKKFAEMNGGEGTIGVEQFIKVMNGVKVKDDLLQTAISQIAYVSQDLNTLNYDFFLRRFTESEANVAV